MILRSQQWRTILVLLAVTVLGACTNSKLVIGPLYNRLDDQMRKEFNKLGDFNAEQKAAFEATVGSFHVWHRQNELPKYATLLRTVAGSIARADQTSREDIAAWFETAESHTQAIRQCHPVNYSFDLMRSLDDEQITFIENRFKRERAKNLARYKKRTPMERAERRLNRIDKWARRVGLELTANQRAMLRTSLGKQISMRPQYYELSDEWNRQFFNIGRDQDSASYDAKMTAHLLKLWSLLETAHPEQWAANRALWRNFALRFVNSMTPEQRAHANQWMKKMANTLDAISNDEPSFKSTNDPGLGCLIESRANIAIPTTSDQTG